MSEIFKIPEKLRKKACTLCKTKITEADPVNEMMTIYWHRPDWEGLLCAYCGNAKVRIFPTKKQKELDNDLQDEKTRQPQEQKVTTRFFTYRTGLITKLKDGSGRVSQKELERIEAAPQQ
eukprot:4373385-Pyramimonas_sp.AAC.1